jgi:hypothetical protein
LLLDPAAAFGGLLLRVLVLSALMSGAAAEWNMHKRRQAFGVRAGRR